MEPGREGATGLSGYLSDIAWMNRCPSVSSRLWPSVAATLLALRPLVTSRLCFIHRCSNSSFICIQHGRNAARKQQRLIFAITRFVFYTTQVVFSGVHSLRVKFCGQ